MLLTSWRADTDTPGFHGNLSSPTGRQVAAGEPADLGHGRASVPGPLHLRHLRRQPAALQQAKNEHPRHETVPPHEKLLPHLPILFGDSHFPCSFVFIIFIFYFFNIHALKVFQEALSGGAEPAAGAVAAAHAAPAAPLRLPAEEEREESRARHRPEDLQDRKRERPRPPFPPLAFPITCGFWSATVPMR